MYHDMCKVKITDFILANVHYHADSRCMGNIDSERIKISKDVKLNSIYIEYLKINGIFLKDH